MPSLKPPPLQLGVNVDHVATLRNARGGVHPDPVKAAKLVARSGADNITAHLREDRRHIRDDDMRRIKEQIDIPLNFEMAATDEMGEIASDILPEACCLVPERREEITTEGGLSVHAGQNHLAPFIRVLQDDGIRVSLFVDPELVELDAARAIGADMVELHTGPYTSATGAARADELTRLQKAAEHAARLGLECHAGHGLTYETVEDVAAIPQIVTVNIGHFLIGEAVMDGLGTAIEKMRHHMDVGRKRIS